MYLSYTMKLVLCASDILSSRGILEVLMLTCRALKSRVLILERGFLAKGTTFLI